MIKLVYPLSSVDSYAHYTVGTRVSDKSGNEYIYLPGTTSVAQYDWVTFTSATGSVTRLVANAKGQVGIAQAAITGPNYGWFQIKGVGSGNTGGAWTSSTGSAVYACGTTATVMTTIVSGDLIAGACIIDSAASGSTGTISLNYPFCTDTLS